MGRRRGGGGDRVALLAPRPREAAKHAWRKPEYTDRQSVLDERSSWAVSGFEQYFESSVFSVRDEMSALLDGLLGSIAASPAEMSGSFQSGFGGGGDYDYVEAAVDRNDHYGGHSGYHHSGSYHDDKCCPLVVDALCLAALLGAVAGATVFLARTFQIELCNLAGQGINNCVGRRRRRRALVGHKMRLLQMFEGKLSHTFDTISS